MSVGTEQNGQRIEFTAYGVIVLGLVTSLLWVLALGWAASLVVPLILNAALDLL